MMVSLPFRSDRTVSVRRWTCNQTCRPLNEGVQELGRMKRSMAPPTLASSQDSACLSTFTPSHVCCLRHDCSCQLTGTTLTFAAAPLQDGSLRNPDYLCSKLEGFYATGRHPMAANLT
jgi:hypothetical protein